MVLQIALRDIGQLTDLGIMAGDQHLGAADPPFRRSSSRATPRRDRDDPRADRGEHGVG
jgi:hypothetical protein